MTTHHWIRIRARPQFLGPASLGTVDAIRILREGAGLTLVQAKAAVDDAVFEGQVARVLVESQDLACALAEQVKQSAPLVFETWVEPQTSVDGLILVIPHKADVEREAVAAAWTLAGGTVERLDRFWAPPPLPRERVRLYGPDTFALVVAQKLGIEVAEPDPYVVAKCPAELLGRAVSVERLGKAPSLTYPCFLKPIIPKQFAARVFASFEQLRDEAQGLDEATEVLRSDVVTLVAEARSFVLDGSVRTCALYEGEGDVLEAQKACEQVAKALTLPRACVLDVGLLDSGQWVFIEANAAWGAGLNGCDAHQALACIEAACAAR